eukprot:3246987-Pleurochrysis_carterae.AAC.3
MHAIARALFAFARASACMCAALRARTCSRTRLCARECMCTFERKRVRNKARARAPRFVHVERRCIVDLRARACVLVLASAGAQACVRWSVHARVGRRVVGSIPRLCGRERAFVRKGS